MSMQSALAALNAAAPGVPEGTPSAIVNINNDGANKSIETAPQGTQETKVNATDAQQTSGEKIEEGVVEAAPLTPEKPEEKKTEENTSSKFAALAKKEKAIVKQQTEIKAHEAAVAAREAAIAAREAQIKESEALWETDVLKALESKGYTYQKLTDLILSGKVAPDKAPEDPIKVARDIETKLRKEFADREAEREAAAKKAADDAKAKQEQELAAAYEEYSTEVAEFTKTNEADYELINMYGQQELIIDTVKQYYEANKRVLSIKEASDMVEKYLYDEAQKALNSKKFASAKKTASETIAEKIVEPVGNKLKAPATKTLSNNLTPTMSSVLPSATDAERMRRALSKLNT